MAVDTSREQATRVPAVRVYLPVTWAGLTTMAAHGELRGAPLEAYAVTGRLRESYADGDLEELEYLALTEAGRASLRLIAASDGRMPRRRVVVAADVPTTAVRPDPTGPSAAVRVTTVVPIARVASVHVDEPAAAEAVQAAVEALPAADAGSSAAADVVGDAEGFELLWYAIQEVADLLAGAPPT